MKKILIALSIALMTVTQVFGMSVRNIRETARFLSDRMAYELDMTPRQYDDVYEINYDFIYAINPLMDDVVRGYYDAIDLYYDYLDWRNDDLRMVLNRAQYNRLLVLDYFYRPIYAYRGSWYFRVYQMYNNKGFFYFDAPTNYRHYNGEHNRRMNKESYYGNRYSHDRYQQRETIRGTQRQQEHSRNDFGHNRRERGETKPNNGYNNRNQQNRTDDRRYNDERKGQNQNSPAINHRDQQGDATHKPANSSNQHNNSGNSQHSNTSNGNNGTTQGHNPRMNKQ